MGPYTLTRFALALLGLLVLGAPFLADGDNPFTLLALMGSGLAFVSLWRVRASAGEPFTWWMAVSASAAGTCAILGVALRSEIASPMDFGVFLGYGIVAGGLNGFAFWLLIQPFSARAQVALPGLAPAAATPPNIKGSVVSELERLQALKEVGGLTEEEFAEVKANVLKGQIGST